MSCWCLALTSRSRTTYSAVLAATKAKAMMMMSEAEKVSRALKSCACRKDLGKGWLRVVMPTEALPVSARSCAVSRALSHTAGACRAVVLQKMPTDRPGLAGGTRAASCPDADTFWRVNTSAPYVLALLLSLSLSRKVLICWYSSAGEVSAKGGGGRRRAARQWQWRLPG